MATLGPTLAENAGVLTYVREVVVAANKVLGGIPVVSVVCTALVAFEQLAETASSNKEELASLLDVTAKTIEVATVNRRTERYPSLEDGFKALESQIERAKEIARQCQGGRFRWIKHLFLCRKISKDIATVKQDIASFASGLTLALSADTNGVVHELSARMSRGASFDATVPKLPPGAPRIRHWYVEREEAVASICKRLGVGASEGALEEPRLVGLAGSSGAGKSTVASMVVSRADVRAHFQGGVIWISVGRGAKDRLSAFMFDVAYSVWETVLHKTALPPRKANVLINSEDGAAYIKEVLPDERSRRVLVVADNVWDVEVLKELKRAGVWVLYTTRQRCLLSEAPPLPLDEVQRKEAEMVLRRAADLDENARLPEAAYELMALCKYVVLDLVLVGRWGTVRGRNDEGAWRTAVGLIVEKQQRGVEEGGKRLSWRAAVLRAGLKELVWDNPQNKELYLALALLPHGLAFPSEVAAVLLYGTGFSKVELRGVEKILEELERWSIVTLEVDDQSCVCRKHTNLYRVHDDHVDFVWECLVKNQDTRETALLRWQEYASSVQALNTYTSGCLVNIWRVLEIVGGRGDVVRKPYDAALRSLHPCSVEEFSKALKKAAEFHFEREDWSEAYAMYARLRLIEEGAEGPDSLVVAKYHHKLGMCANKMAGREAETEKLLRRALDIQTQKLGSCHPFVANTLHSLGICARENGRIEEAERLLRRALTIRRRRLRQDPLSFARALYSLGACVLRAGRSREAERELLRPALEIRRERLGSGHPEVGNSLYYLGLCAQAQGRTKEGEGYLHQALEIFEQQLGKEHRDVGDTLHALGVCARGARRTEEAESFFQRALAIREQEPVVVHSKVSATLEALGECASWAGRTEAAEQFFRRAKGLLEKDPKVAFRYEATVCSGIAMIATPEGDHHGQKILQVCGFMEETTTFMLNRAGLAGAGTDCGEALKQAQDLRFAEADLRQLLAQLMYGAIMSPESIQWRGVFPPLTTVDFAYASKLDSTIKLLGTAMLSPDGDRLSVLVSPVLVSVEYLAEPSVERRGNIVHTGSKEWELDTEQATGFYLRFTCKHSLGTMKQVGHLIEESGVSIHTGTQILHADVGNVDYALATQPCMRSQMDKLSSAIGKQEWVKGVPLVMRFLR